MKRISSVLAVTMMLSIVAFTILYAHSRTQNANRRVLNTNTPPAAQSANTAEGTQSARKGKILVKRLPDGVEGVELKGGMVRLKDGYKFVKNDNGTVSVARMNNGSGVGGSWACTCDEGGDGECEAVIGTKSITCKVKPFTCNSCSLTVVVASVRTAIMR